MIEPLPAYHLFNQSKNINIESIDYENHYDFTEQHRHHYFELFFFNTGGGYQIIDFNNCELKEKSIYLVCPGQIHLMKRSPSANGIVIQFTNEFLMTKQIPWNFLGESLFLEDENLFGDCMVLVEQMKKEIAHNKSEFKDEIVSDLLKIILLKLLGQAGNKMSYHPLMIEFISLIENNYKEWTTVHYYMQEMNVTSKKLNAIVKKHLGKTALHVIHERMLLEIKRLMITDKTKSFKEIGYELNFDSQASFSNFVKKKTGFYPSDLYKELRDED